MTRFYPFLFVLLWSTGFIGAKFGLPYAEPITFLCVRYLLVIAVMGGVALATRAPWPHAPRQWLHIGVTGLLVHATYLGGVFMAISHGLPAGIASLVVGLQPLLTALGAGALLGEKVLPRQWAGLVLGFGGVGLPLRALIDWEFAGARPRLYDAANCIGCAGFEHPSGLVRGFGGVGLVVSHKVAAAASAPELSAMLTPVLVALVGITAGTLYQKRFCPAFDLRTGSVIQFVPCLIVSALLASQTETMLITWSGPFMFALGWLVLVLSVGAISLLNLLIRSGSAVNVASLFYLTPPTTALIAWGVFGETLTGLALAGMAITVFGVWLARK